MRPRSGTEFDLWVVDEQDNPATFPPWLAEAVEDRFGAGPFVVTSSAGLIEARPGDLIMRDGERVTVHTALQARPRSVRPSSPSRAEVALTFLGPPPLGRRNTDRRPQGVHGVLPVLAVAFFLGLMASGLAWLMIKLIGHNPSPL
jgi:hypothetical protein